MRHFRGRAGLTQDAVAAAMKIDKRRLHDWENADVLIRMDKLARFCEVIDVPLLIVVAHAEALVRFGPAEDLISPDLR